MKRQLVAILIIAIALASCKKDTVEQIVYKDKQNSWTQYRDLHASPAILLSSFATHDKLYLSAIDSGTGLDTDLAICHRASPLNYMNQSIKRKNTITEKIFAYYAENNDAEVLSPTV